MIRKRYGDEKVSKKCIVIRKNRVKDMVKNSGARASHRVTQKMRKWATTQELFSSEICEQVQFRHLYHKSEEH